MEAGPPCTHFVRLQVHCLRRGPLAARCGRTARCSTTWKSRIKASLIAARCRPDYPGPMWICRAMKLLGIMALMLMPLSMIQADSGHAAPLGSHMKISAPECGGMDHSDDGAPKPDGPDHCAVACAALPAPDSGLGSGPALTGLIRQREVESDLAGIQPEAAIPPPRSSEACIES